MANNKELLAQELRQIIQADRAAADIIAEAHDISLTIANRTEQEKEAAEAEADKQKADLEHSVRSEQEKLFARRRQEMEEENQAKTQQIQEKIAENRSSWIQDIVGRITAI